MLEPTIYVLSTHNLCFEQKYAKHQEFLSENFQFLMVKFAIYLNRRVFVMYMQIRSLSYADTFLSFLLILYSSSGAV